MMYNIYVLYSKKFDRIYIGQSDNIDRRIKQHNSGHVLSTKAYIPFELVYSEHFGTRDEAVQREKDLKSTTGRRFLRKILKEK